MAAFAQNSVNNSLTGATVSFANGSAAAPSAYWSANYGFFYDATNVGLGLSHAGSQIGWSLTNGFQFDIPGAGGLLSINGEGTTNNTVAAFTNTASNLPVYSLRRNRGTIASPLAVALNDAAGDIRWQPYTGAANTRTMQISGSIIETGTVSGTACGMRLVLALAGIGSASPTEVMRWETLTGVAMYGANVVIDQNRLFKLRTFTVATLPSASASGIGARAFATDASTTMALGNGTAVVGGGANKVPVYSDGTSWIIG